MKHNSIHELRVWGKDQHKWTYGPVYYLELHFDDTQTCRREIQTSCCILHCSHWQFLLMPNLLQTDLHKYAWNENNTTYEVTCMLYWLKSDWVCQGHTWRCSAVRPVHPLTILDLEISLLEWDLRITSSHP